MKTLKESTFERHCRISIRDLDFEIWTKAGSITCQNLDKGWLWLRDFKAAKNPSIPLHTVTMQLLQSKIRVCFFTPCIWLWHVICFVTQAEAWALGCPLLGFLGPPQACPSSLLLDQRLLDAAERSGFFVSPARLTVESPSSVHPVACPQTSELNKWLLLVIE